MTAMGNCNPCIGRNKLPAPWVLLASPERILVPKPFAALPPRDVLTGSLTWHNFLKEMGFSFDGGFFAESGWSHMMRQAHNAFAAVNYSGRTVYDNLSPFLEKAIADGGYELLNPCEPIGDWVLVKFNASQERKPDQGAKPKRAAPQSWFSWS